MPPSRPRSSTCWSTTRAVSSESSNGRCSISTRRRYRHAISPKLRSGVLERLLERNPPRLAHRLPLVSADARRRPFDAVVRAPVAEDKLFFRVQLRLPGEFTVADTHGS